MTPGKPNPKVRARLAEALTDVAIETDRHHKTRDHTMALLRFGYNGESGVAEALEALYRVFVVTVGPDRMGGEARGRWGVRELRRWRGGTAGRRATPCRVSNGPAPHRRSAVREPTTAARTTPVGRQTTTSARVRPTSGCSAPSSPASTGSPGSAGPTHTRCWDLCCVGRSPSWSRASNSRRPLALRPRSTCSRSTWAAAARARTSPTGWAAMPWCSRTPTAPRSTTRTRPASDRVRAWPACSKAMAAKTSHRAVSMWRSTRSAP